ncbi:6-phosphogluconolactonase [Methylomagnum ishizawai]|uniref:6-phosphogluconolactonase n=1 Tax=Methylomagnum ishizawai TaxID=1760988 RepID=UPI001C32A446|nr:6-phosphogluconolactonase [Methylomagnum ishizawai]BBL73584.1 6-phosphogluconolactonase [Methylomagnum ishizawai]
MSERELFIAGGADDLAREAAVRFLDAAQQSIADHGRCAVALSGGSTPKRLYRLLAQPPYRYAVDWSKVYMFFADERFVPHDDPDSTMLLARETLFDHVPLPPENIFPMPTVGLAPEQAAAEHAATLAAFFASPLPKFDLILLGMGPDGHTASLFPGFPDYPGSVAAVHGSPKPPPTRLTLTLDAINQARRILFLVTGADKAETLRTVFADPAPTAASLPAARIKAEGAAWLVDREAGSALI